MIIACRKLSDRVFTLCSILAVMLMASVLLVVLVPVLWRGAGAYVFRGTVEHRRMMMGEFSRGSEVRLSAELLAVRKAREPVYQAIEAFEAEMSELPLARRKELRPAFKEVKEGVALLF
ncbi:MAG: phosphate ABC transporter, permease protein PstA, partial [Kiritimatiellae bacterium]|nr:phosphate ABC transporter, permease protein PstA [Kiritimatiellia bacterium]